MVQDGSAAVAVLWLLAKATALLAVAAMVQAAIRRRGSAATRHMVWALTVAGLLALPVMSLALPGWIVELQTSGPLGASPEATLDAETAAPLESASRSLATPADVSPVALAPASFGWPAVLLAIYAAGVLAMLIHLGIQRRSVRRLTADARRIEDASWIRLLEESASALGVRRQVRLLRSRSRSMPMTVGTRHPAILMPAIADTWPDDRKQAVVLHELAHVARFDCLTQTLAFLAAALYWFHPGVWWVARRLRIERELACDDLVLAAGARARDYASHLLEIAYAAGSSRAPAIAVTMARPRQLEGRMLAVLDTARNRNLPPPRACMAGAAVAAMVVAALATATVTIVAVDREIGGAPPAAPQASIAPQTAAPKAEAQDRPVPGAGTWEIQPSRTAGVVRVRLAAGSSSSSFDMAIAELESLTGVKLSTTGPVQFRLRRDAGTFAFDGVVRGGVGAGTFSFAPDPAFAAELAKRGFARPTAYQQYEMARHDIGFAFIDELGKQGYGKPDLAELVRAGQHGVQATYVREMAALGYRLGTLAPLIELRDHGVTPAYVQALAELGYKGLSADEIRKARDHGVTAEYVRGMRDAGYGSLSMPQLINARDHGVTPDYVRGLAEAGFTKLPMDEAVRTRDHGVTPEYVREMKALGHAEPLGELVRARDHGVDVQFVRGMAAQGYGTLRLDALIRVRDHGVTPKYAEELKALGYDRLTADDLVTLRDHGLTADRVRAANARAGTRLPVDMLKSLAARGMR